MHYSSEILRGKYEKRVTKDAVKSKRAASTEGKRTKGKGEKGNGKTDQPPGAVANESD
jgi:hypothetical protein